MFLLKPHNPIDHFFHKWMQMVLLAAKHVRIVDFFLLKLQPIGSKNPGKTKDFQSPWVLQ